MPNQDDVEFAGVPAMVLHRATEPKILAGTLQRDDEAGVPVPGPISVELAGSSQAMPRQNLYREDYDRPLGQFQAAMGFANTAVAAILCVATTSFCLFVLANVVPLLVTISTLPPVLRIGSYAVLFFVAALLGYFSLRLAWLYRKLRVNQQLAFTEMAAIESRSETRRLNQQLEAEGVVRLQHYLETYPCDDRQRSLILACGRSEQTWKQLITARHRLASGPERTTRKNWIGEYLDQFQSQLDLAGHRVVRDYAVVAGTKTALSPNAVIDGVVLLYCGLGMFGKLCTVYNLKLGPLATAKFVGWVFTHAYLGGKLEEFSDTVEDSLEEPLNEAFQSAGIVAASSLASVAGSAATKASQGLANALLMRRLGRHAMRLLRPVIAP